LRSFWLQWSLDEGSPKLPKPGDHFYKEIRTAKFNIEVLKEKPGKESYFS